MSALSHIVLFKLISLDMEHYLVVRPRSSACPFVWVRRIYGVHADLTQSTRINTGQEKGLFWQCYMLLLF